MDQAEKATEIKRVFQQLETKRQPYESVWKEVTEFVLPRRSVWEIDNDGPAPPSKLYNSHALQALKLQTYGFEGYMVSRSRPWFKLRVPEKVRRSYGVSDYLEKSEQIVLEALAASNFYEAAGEFIMDGGGIGTATCFCDEDQRTGKVYFSTRHPKEIYIADNHRGEADMVFRRFRITKRAAMQRWGKKNHERVQADVEKDPFGYVQMIHCIQPRTDRNPRSMLSTDFPWSSIYLDLDNNHIVAEGGYEERPFFAWRWNKNSDEVYGRSPGIDALTDVKMLNQVSRTRLNLAHLTSDPPWNVPITIKGNERILPHGMNYITKGEQVSPVVVGANYPINVDVEKKIEKVIDDHFNVQFFLMISNMEREMTAREVMERKGEQAAVLGAAIGRFENEFLAPAIMRVAGILGRQGAFPERPAALDEAGPITIEYTGYLSQLQRRFYETGGISESVSFILPLAQMDPTVLDNIDMDELARTAADGFGLPQKILREIADVDKIRALKAQQQQQAAQQQQQLAAQQTIAQNANKLNEPVNAGSVLQKLVGGGGQ